MEQHRATLMGMPPEQQSQMVHNEWVQQEARRDGNQGNVTLVKDGSMRLLSEAETGGATETYTWGQTEAEVTVRIAAPEGLRSREVAFVVGTKRISLRVRGQPVLEGPLHREVLADDSTYSIEDVETTSERRPSQRQVVVSLVKAKRTGGKEHWSCVVEGEGKIDTIGFGPKVLMANIHNPQDMAEHMHMLQPGP